MSRQNIAKLLFLIMLYATMPIVSIVYPQSEYESNNSCIIELEEPRRDIVDEIFQADGENLPAPDFKAPSALFIWLRERGLTFTLRLS